MSKQGVQQVIQKAVSDAAFRRQLQREPAKALAGFDLTADERASVTGGDPARLTALGVDQRMSKAFALGAAADASTPVSNATIGDMGTAGTAAFMDEGTAVSGTTGTQSGIIGDPTSGASSVFAGDPTTGATGADISNDGPQLDAGVAGDPTSGATAVIPDPTTAGVSAFDDVDTSGDMNSLDAGFTGGASGSLADDPSALTGQLDDVSSGLDTGGEIRPTEY